MQAMGLTAVQVNQQLRELNMDAAGGRAQIGGGEQAIRVLGGAKSAAALGDAEIIVPGGKFVRLREIAEVRDGIAEVRSVARLNGRPATVFGVYKAKGASDVSTAKAVQVELDKILVENPALHMQVIFTTVDHTIATYHSSLEALIEGSILAVAVVWFFLRSWRATLISALAIPLSAIPTFAIMQLMGFTLNTITLLGLSLVAGVLVDDAIVEIENIVRHMRMGKSGFQAALEAADEIGLAVVATSFTIIAVFLPVSFMSGISGQYFKQFGLTVATAVFISLMVARMITPVLAAYGLHSNSLAVHSSDGPIMTGYLKALNWSVANRWKTIAGRRSFFCAVGWRPDGDSEGVRAGGGFLDFASSMSSCRPAARWRIPRASRGRRPIWSGNRRKSPTPSNWWAAMAMNLRQAFTFVTLVPRDKRSLSEKEWEQKMQPLLTQVPDGHLNFNGQTFGGRDISLFLIGDDPALVEIAGHKVLDEMRALPELRDARINGDLPRPEIVVHPRLDIAAQLGVSVHSISETIRIATLGDLPQNGAKFSLTDRQIPIRVSLPENARHDLTTLENLPVPTAAGASVPLEDRRRPEFWAGALRGAPLQHEPARVSRCRSHPRRRARHGQHQGACAAGAEESAAGRAPGGNRQHRIHDRIGGWVHAGHRRGGADGSGRAGAAVRSCVPAHHNFVGAAAVARAAPCSRCC